MLVYAKWLQAGVHTQGGPDGPIATISEHMVQARALDPAGEGEKDRKSMSGACACKLRACGASARALGPVGEREREKWSYVWPVRVHA